MTVARFKKIILGTGLTGTDNGDDTITIDASGGSGDVATDAIWDTKGDLAVASGADAADNLPVGTNGQVLVADSAQTLGVAWADPAAVAWTTITKTTDESVASNNTPQNDDELFFSTTSGKVYAIEAVIVYASPAGGATPDIRMAFGEDTPSTRGVLLGASVSTGDAANTTISGKTDQLANWLAGTATANRAAAFWGQHVGNGGTFRFLWAQNVSGTNATVVRAGSYLRYRVVL